MQEIAPRLRGRLPGVKLNVVGNDPVGIAAGIVRGSIDINFVGWVPDVLPHLHRARLSVAPMRFGSGMKGKVAEALCAGLPVVVTTIASEGMSLSDEEHVLIADEASEFADTVARAYEDRQLWDHLRHAGRMATI